MTGRPRIRRNLVITVSVMLIAGAGLGFPLFHGSGPSDPEPDLPPVSTVTPSPPDDPEAVAPGSVLDTRSRALDTLHVSMLAAAYPDRIQEIRRFEDEWALLMDDRWFFWEEGRLLPEEARPERSSYTALHFYNYQLGAHELPELTEAQRAALRDYGDRLAGRPVPPGDSVPSGGYRGRHPDFLDVLWGFSRALDADRAMQRIRFLNIATRVHPAIVEPLRRVEAEIREGMQGDPELRAFVQNILMVSGFFWREVPGTNVRSFHAYGTAIDLLPRRYDGFGYWRWARDSGVTNWWEIPLENRFRIPQAVIDAFEANGFVWGGKWASFDPVHFEYRPEVIASARARALPAVEARAVYSPAEATLLR